MEPSGPVKACIGVALPFVNIYIIVFGLIILRMENVSYNYVK
jgi:hypothetical protein